MQAHEPFPFTPQQEAVLASLTRGANRTTACHAAHIPRRTFYNWIEKDPAFAETVEEAEAEPIGVAEDLAYACAMKAAEDPRYLRALFFWLKHRAGWVQARPEPTPASGPSPTPPARHAVPSPDAGTLVGDSDDLALVMKLANELQRREHKDEAFMRGYEEWKRLSEEEREALRSEEMGRITSLDQDSSPSGDGAPHAEKPGNGVPSVPSDAGVSAHEVNRRGLPMACPPLPPAPASDGTGEKPEKRVPSVPPRQQAKMRLRQFRGKRRK